MTGATYIVTRLLLFSLIRTGVNGGDGLMFTERAYNITFPCEDDTGEVCFYMWQISRNQTTEYVAIVSNGEIQSRVSEDNNCNQQIRELTAEDVGHHRCQQRTNDLSPHNIVQEVNLRLNKTVSLQCVFLTYVEHGHCFTQQEQRVSLMWVDEAGTKVPEDSRHQIKQQTVCSTTLTVTLQNTEKRKFRCQANVDEQTQTSLELTVGDSGLQKRGRRFRINPEPQGGSQHIVGGAAGVAGCVALTAVVVAIFVISKRRTKASRQPDEPGTDQSTAINAVNTDDVTYADVIFSAGTERVWTPGCESTEYTCVQYK